MANNLDGHGVRLTGRIPAVALGPALVCLVVAGSAAGVARAAAPEIATGAPVTLSVLGGPVEFDLSGTGVVPGAAVRLTRALTPRVDLDGGALFVRPDEQSGRSTLVLPEVHLRYRWPIGRVSPFVSGGGGSAVLSRDHGWDTRLALSLGTGAHVRITDTVGIVGEVRARGISRNFAGSVAEAMGGLTWRLR